MRKGKYKETLEEILELLGGGLCDDCHCEGCKWEVSEAIRVAKTALDIPIQRIQCPHCKAVDTVWADKSTGMKQTCHKCHKKVEVFNFIEAREGEES